MAERERSLIDGIGERRIQDGWESGASNAYSVIHVLTVKSHVSILSQSL